VERRAVIVGGVATLVAPNAAGAQQADKVARIGVLAVSAAAFSPRIEAFRRGLREHGYVEGKNIVFEYRYAEGKLDRLPDLAVELVALKVDVIVTASPPSVRAAKRATSTIPIVFAAVGDPVATGLVKSLARPGGNVTGLSILGPELDGKRLELLKEAVTKTSRVAVLFGPESPRKELEIAAQALGIQLVLLPVRELGDFEPAFETARKESVHALLTSPSPLLNTVRERIVELAAKNRLPAMYGSSEFVEAGGLMSYAPSYVDLFRRAAIYVDKILRGAKPADLPVEQATKFELVINLKTAKALGLTISPSLLARADQVIE
jgi:putative tryptophan/tyrosine transport system substrate-binding protein